MPALPPLWKREIQKAVKESADCAAQERVRNDKETSAAVALPLHDLVQEFKAYQERQGRESEETATRERVTIAALILTVVFTFLTVVIFHGQLSEMKSTGVQSPLKLPENSGRRPAFPLEKSQPVPKTDELSLSRSVHFNFVKRERNGN